MFNSARSRSMIKKLEICDSQVTVSAHEPLVILYNLGHKTTALFK